MTTVIVIGQGIAGFSAALAAKRKGAQVIVVSGPSASTAMVSGAWDVSPPRLMVDRPLGEQPLNAICDRFGVDAAQFMKAHDDVIAALEIYGPVSWQMPCPKVLTEFGVLRTVAAVQHEVLNLENIPDGTVLIGDGSDRREVSNKYSASHLSAALHAKSGRVCEVLRLETLSVDAIVKVLSEYSQAARPAALVMPPSDVLSYRDFVAIRNATGVQVGEVACSLAGPQSRRLTQRIDRLLSEMGCDRMASWVKSVDVLESSVRLTMETGSVVEADAAVLATGKYFASGMNARDDGISVGIAGISPYSDGCASRLRGSIQGPAPELVFQDFISSMPHAAPSGFRMGVGHDNRFHVLDEAQKPLERLYAAGSILETMDLGDDATLGLCAVTGHLAGTFVAQDWEAK